MNHIIINTTMLMSWGEQVISYNVIYIYINYAAGGIASIGNR